MAGYSKIYCIGDDGWDGINPIYFQILVGDADRQWLESRYFDRRIRPIGKIKVIIPAGPDHPDTLIDACLAFCPKYFESCPSLVSVSEVLKNKRRIDFRNVREVYRKALKAGTLTQLAVITESRKGYR